MRYVTGDEVYVLRMYGDEIEPLSGVVCATHWKGTGGRLFPSNPTSNYIDYDVVLASGNMVGVAEGWLAPRNIVINELPDTPWD